LFTWYISTTLNDLSCVVVLMLSDVTLHLSHNIVYTNETNTCLKGVKL